MAESYSQPPAYSSELQLAENYGTLYPKIEPSDLLILQTDEVSQVSSQELQVSIIESQKNELKENFDIIRNKLDERERSIFELLEKSESDEIGSEYVRNQLAKLYLTKSNLEESMKDPLMGLTLAESLETIKGQITRLEKQLNTAKYLRWNMSECESAIENLCFVCEGKDLLDFHKRKRELLWENVAPGCERTQIHKPTGLTIEPKTDHIYIADSGNKRIQVYNSQGKHLSQIALPVGEMILFFSFLGEYLFIIELVGKKLCLFKLSPSTGKAVKRIIVGSDHTYNEFYSSSGRNSLFLIDMIKNASLTLTLCIYENYHKLWTECIYFDTLDVVKRDGDGVIELHSPHIKDFTVPIDVKIVGSSHEMTQFYVLYQNSVFALQVFNWSGEVVRSIIALHLYNVLSLLLVDDENNLIICTVKRTIFTKQSKDKQAIGDIIENLYSFYVYSDSGDRQHKWTYKSANRGSMIQSIFVKPFRQRKESTGATKQPDSISHAPIFGVCLNSKQQLIMLHVQEYGYLLRAF